MTTIGDAVEIMEILRYYFGDDVDHPYVIDKRLSRLTGKPTLTRVKNDAKRQEKLF